MARDQNTFAKRRREMEKKRKAEDKRERRRKKKDQVDEPAGAASEIAAEDGAPEPDDVAAELLDRPVTS